MVKIFVKNRRLCIISLKTIILFLSLLLLTGCDRGLFIYNPHNTYNGSVTEMSLITYSNEDYLDSELNGTISIDNIVIIETLETDEIDSFLEEISEIYANGSLVDESHAPSGFGTLIRYSTGNFELTTLRQDEELVYFGTYDSDYECISYFGAVWPEAANRYLEILDTYFEYEYSEQ